MHEYTKFIYMQLIRFTYVNKKLICFKAIVVWTNEPLSKFIREHDMFYEELYFNAHAYSHEWFNVMVKNEENTIGIGNKHSVLWI